MMHEPSTDHEWIAECAMTLRDIQPLGLDYAGSTARGTELSEGGRWRSMGGARAALVWAGENGGGEAAAGELSKRIRWICEFAGSYLDHANFDDRLAGDDVEDIACLCCDDPTMYALAPEVAVRLVLGEQ